MTQTKRNDAEKQTNLAVVAPEREAEFSGQEHPRSLQESPASYDC